MHSFNCTTHLLIHPCQAQLSSLCSSICLDAAKLQSLKRRQDCAHPEHGLCHHSKPHLGQVRWAAALRLPVPLKAPGPQLLGTPKNWKNRAAAPAPGPRGEPHVWDQNFLLKGKGNQSALQQDTLTQRQRGATVPLGCSQQCQR